MTTNPVKSISLLFALMPLLAWPNPAFPAQAFVGEAFTLAAEFWEQPRSATALLEQPALRRSVSAWLSKPEGMLVIHHGSGEEALLRAEELRTWLIALAVEATRIDVAGDLPGSNELKIELTTKRGHR